MNKENAIDFACSYLWRAYYQETFYGEHLPPLEPQHIVQSISEPQHIVRGLTSKERDEFNQLKANLLFLDKKINQHLDMKKKSKYTKYIIS